MGALRTLLGLLLCTPLLLLSTGLAAGTDASLTPQVCRVGKNVPAFTGWMWKPNGRVRVFTVADHFSAEEVKLLHQSLLSWSALADATGSRVSFSYEGPTKEVQNCDYCLTLTRGRIRRSNHVAQLEAVGVVNSYVIKYAKIIVDPKIKDPKELSNVLAHEIGHSFGLMDCYTCQDKTTVMNAVNASRGRMTPSECDVGQVRQAYQRLAQHIHQLEEQAKLLMDEGEEPVEDDTPIIIEKPQ